MNEQTPGGVGQPGIEAVEGAANGVNEGAPIGFFAVGLAINLALLAAFFVWARGQWKKSGKRDRS